jgi:hydrogenase maturation factor
MCLGAYGTIVELIGESRAAVRFGDGTQRDVSLAVLVADGVRARAGDVVAVSIGMALHLFDPQAPERDPGAQDIGDPDTGNREEVATW